MVEQDQKKKKPGLIKKILRWLGIGIITILFLLALVFHAPPKIFLLILIFLAANTALPFPYRKYFWLTAAGVVIALIVWILLPINNEGWQPYQYNFDKELQKLQTQKSIPPEENAATFYNQLMETYDANDYYIFDLLNSDSDTWDKIFQNPWRSEDYPEIHDSLEHIQGAIDTLIEISEIKQCAFPISDPYSPSDRNSAIRGWARLLVIAINNDIAEGHADKAIQKFAAILQMARHQYQQPTSIDYLHGIGVEGLVLLHLNRMIVESNDLDQHLNIIDKVILDIKSNWNSIFANTLEYDKMVTKTDIAMYYEINTKGRIRLSRDPWAKLRIFGRELYEFEGIDINETKPSLAYFLYPSYLEQKLIKAQTILRWFTMPSDPEKAAEMLGTCLDKYDFMTEADFDWTIKPENPDSLPAWMNVYRIIFYQLHFDQLMADKWAESKYSSHDLYLRTLTMRRGSRLLLAIKQYYNQHDTWPPDLDSIKTTAPAEAFLDPVTGKPLQYENHGEHFSLYGKLINIWPQ